MSNGRGQSDLDLDDSRRLSFNEAADRLGLSRYRIDQLTQVAQEIPFIYEEGGRTKYFVEAEALDRWEESRRSRMVTLFENDYQESLEFALRSFYSDQTRSDFLTGTRRDAGKYVTDFVRGKLGEIGFQKYMEQEHGLRIGLDFDPDRGPVVGQDITEVQRVGRGAVNPPRLHVAIKTTKELNNYLLVPDHEVEDRDRRSDVYVLVRVAIYPDHLLRAIRGHDAFEDVEDLIPEFETIRAEMAGFAWRDELAADDPVEEIENVPSLAQPNYAMRTGNLRKGEDEWQELAEGILTGTDHS